MPPHRTLFTSARVGFSKFKVDQIGNEINSGKLIGTRECLAMQIGHFLGRGGRRGLPSLRQIQHVHITWETSNRRTARENGLPPSEITAGGAQTPKRDPDCSAPPSPGSFGTEAVVPRSARGHLRNQNNVRDRATKSGDHGRRPSRGSGGPRRCRPARLSTRGTGTRDTADTFRRPRPSSVQSPTDVSGPPRPGITRFPDRRGSFEVRTHLAHAGPDAGAAAAGVLGADLVDGARHLPRLLLLLLLFPLALFWPAWRLPACPPRPPCPPAPVSSGLVL